MCLKVIQNVLEKEEKSKQKKPLDFPLRLCNLTNGFPDGERGLQLSFP
jgi:hypothetical protein